MNIDDKLDALKNLQQVDAPPFLYTRIRQRIHSLETEVAPVQWKWGFALGSLLVISVNLSTWLRTDVAKEKTGIETVVSNMQLATLNGLYQ